MDSGISIWKDHEPRLLLRLGLIDVMSLMRLRMPMLRMTKLQMILLPALLGLRMLQLILLPLYFLWFQMFFDAVEVQLSNSCGMPWAPVEDVGEPVENLDEGVAIPRRGQLQ